MDKDQMRDMARHARRSVLRLAVHRRRRHQLHGLELGHDRRPDAVLVPLGPRRRQPARRARPAGRRPVVVLGRHACATGGRSACAPASTAIYFGLRMRGPMFRLLQTLGLTPIMLGYGPDDLHQFIDLSRRYRPTVFYAMTAYLGVGLQEIERTHGRRHARRVRQLQGHPVRRRAGRPAAAPDLRALGARRQDLQPDELRRHRPCARLPRARRLPRVGRHRRGRDHRPGDRRADRRRRPRRAGGAPRS